MAVRYGVIMITKKVLLIHSEPTVQEVLQACLTNLGGWQVLSVRSPLAGLQVAAQEQPDAIVFDLSTCGMNFFTFLKRLRSCSETHQIPIVLITVESKWLSQSALRPLQIAGVIDYSINPAELPRQIATLLNWEQASFTHELDV